MTGYAGLPMSDADLEKHYEASKFDVIDLVGSEVRQIIGELRYYRAAPAQAVAPPGWLSIESAPKDGTMIRLLIDYRDGGGAFEDAAQAWTIGFNSFENTGEDRWQFAGWCWAHDHFTEGSGAPVGWLPWSNPSAGGDDQ